ncbi:MAG: FAD-dependent oxidoreductase [Acidobacteriota bacterium]|nr:FAD-dependent oxidoreductase [Acidobacteriota bacterium]
MLPTEGDVVVVGGGLAGLSAAWYLSAAGRQVTVLEKGARLGGKAGSEDVLDAEGNRAYRSDHGYHLFPEWYLNVKDLMGAIGLDYDAITVPGEKFISSFGTTTQSTTGDKADGGYGSAALWLSFLSSVLQLIVADDDELRPLSVAEFLEKRNGKGDFVAAARLRHESLLLKALANHAESMSALSVARMYRRWVIPASNILKPSWSALRGPLQTYFIDPLEKALLEVGVVIEKGVAVAGLETDADGITALRLSSNDHGDRRLETPGPVVLAIPPDALGLILGGDPPEILSDLIDVSRLRMAVMSAVDVHYSDQVKTPGDHFSIPESQQDLTAYDITRNWDPEELPRTVKDGDRVVRTILQVIATEPDGLELLTDPDVELKDRVLSEVERLDTVPIDRDASVIHVNQDAQLFMNDKGVDGRRPQVNHERAKNLYLAGDYCQSSIDVASMEAAVATGRIAATAVLTGRTVDTAPAVTRGIRIAEKVSRFIPRSWGLLRRVLR